ncbi:Uncharacterised protein [Vibrio cholerae]|uniref:Uncharacterized protein n=1 Tax=Vibrio cholerae TaxID=666 RepID=A0A655QBI1_VIBCL|nr:Uncharacterised protein [Vibrio cholerae]CSA28298.1 Uncharacterised protein [Vibrio cholerae]CSA48518.1 Uncharacterised protein [Vibrio cholerae]CSA65124.1 Uncharacterised protein [Vibrio cholerae]CSA98196.1 Uncharacterised protein [Vibrio cholerae]
MPIGQVAGEVIRPKHRHHAQRPMAQYQLITRRFTHGFTGTLMISTNRNCDFSGDRRRFRARFPQRLARLFSNHLRNLFAVGFHQFRKGQHLLFTLSKWAFFPVEKSAASGLHRRVDLLATSAVTLP